VPQLELLVCVLTQAPPQQVLPPAQAMPQAPQLALLVWVLTQLPPQPVSPAPQQVLLEQLVPAAQAMPQAPQLELLVWVLAHEPVQQTVPPRQALPQVPQLELLLLKLMQLPPQPVSPAAQQVPLEQLVPAAQAVPQAPQLAVVVRAASHPLARTPSQLPKPLEQVTPHMPPAQVAVPLAYGPHAVPQAPQLAVVLSVVSQPLPRTPSQLPKPLVQVTPHAPPAQVAVPLAYGPHAVPQVPQLEVELRLVSQPLPRRPSQLPKPLLQVTPHAPPEQVAVPLA
jgi:hypothetical protein